MGAPRRRYLGSYCHTCKWWRYEENGKFADAHHRHAQRNCTGHMRLEGGFMTGKEMATLLEDRIHAELS